ncbi:LuxR family transcriptional regulator [Nocardioides sp. R-C-SC26]|uniref:LuxR family transcriptional regulator n=1 Tax=Nocardioides sp. R-C-SC26 TaxID=2870414 RepID=UPI001E3F0BE6|nr:LuxR family transcriptional regulator [Nocardioides sp. R-C-SC26]
MSDGAVGSRDRDLFESTAIALFERILEQHGLPGDDPALDEDRTRAAFDLLVDVGLVQLDRDRDVWLPVDPSAVQSRVVAPMSQEASRLLEESTHWARGFAALSQAWRRSPQAETAGPFTYLRDDAIGPFLAGLVAEAEEEMLTAQPQVGRDASSLAAAALRDVAMLERGTRMRTLYQHSARRSTYTQKYVDAVTQRGAEVRTLDEFFRRMIVVDRRVAVIPANDDHRSAVVVRESSVIDFLVDIFERTWERARPFGDKEHGLLRDIASEQRAMTIRMLIEGHADATSAKRLGVSARTYAGYVADLKDEFGAETRFQLGYILGQRGVDGRE